MKKAKIICTIGPSSESKKVITQLINAGMDVARLNFSHGSHESHLKVIENIRECSQKIKRPIAILQDLQGVKIRIGMVENGAIHLKEKSKVTLRSGQSLSNDRHIFITYRNLLKDVGVGDRILIEDGRIQLIAKDKNIDHLVAVVEEGGILRDKKGVNLPDTKISLQSFTRKDRDDLDFGLKAGVDYVALSFVKNKSDLSKLKNFLKSQNKTLPIIAKIEKPEALANIEEIIHEADGIMIARGDLAVEMSPEAVPVLQKELIIKANQSGKIVIVATQMLESMTSRRSPTRAEASDVANAVIDGTDALMLSSETTVGKYPVDSLKMMRKIIEHTEKNTLTLKSAESESTESDFDRIPADVKRRKGFPYAISDAACRAAEDVKADLIIAFTHSGYTALLISKNRPKAPVIAFTPQDHIMRQMYLYWGVTPHLIRQLTNTDEMIKEIEHIVLKENILKKGEMVAIVASSPLSIMGKTNFIKLHRIGDL